MSSTQKKKLAKTHEKERLQQSAAAAVASGGGAAIAALLLEEQAAFNEHAPKTLAWLQKLQLADEVNTAALSFVGSEIHVGSLTLRTPIWAVAPMVTQCDPAFRQLCRRYGATLVYSEMLVAAEFAADADYRRIGLGLREGETQVAPEDHPLVVQFAANEPGTLLAAALAAQACGADAVDINLGCPQNRAKEQHYGSYLTDPVDWALVCEMVRHCIASDELRIPVTCKIRLQPTISATIDFARRLEAAGCMLPLPCAARTHLLAHVHSLISHVATRGHCGQAHCSQCMGGSAGAKGCVATAPRTSRR